MSDDYFWWLEQINRAAEFEMRQASAWIDEVLPPPLSPFEKEAASRRQERLHDRDDILLDIAQQHDQAIEGSGCPSPDVPHGHGLFGADSYVDQSTLVHDFGDGWTIKKPKTFGDMKYEGESMDNCIVDDADKMCESCSATGKCGQCGGERRFPCWNCEASGELPCQNYGCTDGDIDCSKCGGGFYRNVKCNTCDKDRPGEQTICATCDMPQEHHDKLVKGPNEWDAHPFAAKVITCSGCYGKGHRTEHLKGQISCPECAGSDKNCETCKGDGHIECDDCFGTGKEEDEFCGGSGFVTCNSCHGDKYEDCTNCGGDGDCPKCQGLKLGGGPRHYYRAFTKHEAEAFEKTKPNGVISLRDADNIPHVSFLQDEENNITDVFGRQDHVPKAPYQHRILQYAKTQLPQDGVCDGCEGSGETQIRQQRVCDGCGGRAVTSLDGKILEPWDTRGWDEGQHKQCEKCQGSRIKWEHQRTDCPGCGGDGKAKIGVVWGHNRNTSWYDHDSIDEITSGSLKPPHVLLFARSKLNGSLVQPLHDANAAHKLRYEEDVNGPVTKEPCTNCTDAPLSDGRCWKCNGTRTKTIMAMHCDTHDLIAIPSLAIGHHNLTFKPNDESWELKSGKASKVLWDEAGQKVSWEATDALCNNCYGGGIVSGAACDKCGRTGGNSARLDVPEMAKEFFPVIEKHPKVAWKKVSHETSLDHVHDPLGQEHHPMYTGTGPVTPEHIEEFYKDPRWQGHGFLSGAFNKPEMHAALAQAATELGTSHDDLFNWANSSKAGSFLGRSMPSRECPNCETYACPKCGTGFYNESADPERTWGSKDGKCRQCDTDMGSVAEDLKRGGFKGDPWSTGTYKFGWDKIRCEDCGSDLNAPMISIKTGEHDPGKDEQRAQGIFRNMGIEVPHRITDRQDVPYERKHLVQLLKEQIPGDIADQKEEAEFGYCTECHDTKNRCKHALEERFKE